ATLRGIFGWQTPMGSADWGSTVAAFRSSSQPDVAIFPIALEATIARHNGDFERAGAVIDAAWNTPDAASQCGAASPLVSLQPFRAWLHARLGEHAESEVLYSLWTQWVESGLHGGDTKVDCYYTAADGGAMVNLTISQRISTLLIPMSREGAFQAGVGLSSGGDERGDPICTVPTRRTPRPDL